MVSTVQFGLDGKDARSDVVPRISHAKLFRTFRAGSADGVHFNTLDNDFVGLPVSFLGLILLVFWGDIVGSVLTRFSGREGEVSSCRFAEARCRSMAWLILPSARMRTSKRLSAN